MNALDFSMAKLAHQQWKFRVRSYLDGLEEMSSTEISSHHDCDFGKWLYSTGMQELTGMPELGNLERSHAEMHGAIKLAVEARRNGNLAEAERQYARVVELSNTVVGLIDKIMVH